MGLVAFPEWSVMGCLSRVPDRRSRRGRQYPLAGILGMLLLAAVNGESSLRGMWMWGVERWQRIRYELGMVEFPEPPVLSTVWYVLDELDTEALEVALSGWIESQAGERTRGVSIDGKQLRGSKRGGGGALQVVVAAGQELKVILKQQAVVQGDEVDAALALLARVPLKGRWVTMDAGLLNRRTAQCILERGGDYVGVVKGNHEAVRGAVDEWVTEAISPLGRATQAGLGRAKQGARAD